MYLRNPSQPKRRTSQVKMFPAPTAGWVSNRNISTPQDGAQGAVILDNFFPTATGAILRRGRQLTVTIGDADEDVKSMFSYVVGPQRQLFGAIDSGIYDITDPDASSLVWDGTTNGNWSTVQFATTGGIYLIGVNGEDPGFIYDGANFWENVDGGIWSLGYDAKTSDFTEGEIIVGAISGASATIYRVDDNGDGTGTLILRNVQNSPFQDNEGMTGNMGGDATSNGVEENVVPGVSFTGGSEDSSIENMSYVWAYKSRLFFAQKESLNAWYLDDPDAIGGIASVFPLGADFGRGGSLLFGYGWSLDSGASGGLSEQCIFVSTEGEVAVYQGTDPGVAQNWSKVGVYRIGRPLGKKAFIRAGGDIVIATTIGQIPLSQAIQRDFAALSPAAVSYPIEDAWNRAIDERGFEDWVCELWPENQMMVVAPPNVEGSNEPVAFVANARTGAWGRYTNWNIISMHVFDGRLYFGSTNGRVFEANVGGLDGSDTFTGVYMPLFEDMGSSYSLKVGTVGRAVLRSRAVVEELINLHTDYDMTLDPAPNAAPIPTGNVWGLAQWGTAKWGVVGSGVMKQTSHSLAGAGNSLSMSLQVTSGANVPIDTEIIRLELVYNTAEILS